MQADCEVDPEDTAQLDWDSQESWAIYATLSLHFRGTSETEGPNFKVPWSSIWTENAQADNG